MQFVSRNTHVVDPAETGSVSTLGPAWSSGASSSVPLADMEQELQLPSLEGGKKPSEVISVYIKGLMNRSSKLSDSLSKLTGAGPGLPESAEKPDPYKPVQRFVSKLAYPN